MITRREFVVGAAATVRKNILVGIPARLYEF